MVIIGITWKINHHLSWNVLQYKFTLICPTDCQFAWFSCCIGQNFTRKICTVWCLGNSSLRRTLGFLNWSLFFMQMRKQLLPMQPVCLSWQWSASRTIPVLLDYPWTISFLKVRLRMRLTTGQTQASLHILDSKRRWQNSWLYRLQVETCYRKLGPWGRSARSFQAQAPFPRTPSFDCGHSQQ